MIPNKYIDIQCTLVLFFPVFANQNPPASTSLATLTKTAGCIPTISILELSRPFDILMFPPGWLAPRMCARITGSGATYGAKRSRHPQTLQSTRSAGPRLDDSFAVVFRSGD